MSVQNWQAWMALLPCERCGWDPDDCWCRKAVPRSAPPPPPRRKREKTLPILTLEERRTAYASLTVVDADEHSQGRGAA